MSTNALDALIDLLENVLYGEIEYDEGVCTLFDHIDEIIKNLRSFCPIEGRTNYDSDLHAFDIEISCVIQDLVRGPQILPSLIPSELQNFRTNMVNAISNLISAPLSPPNLAPMVTVQNTELHEKESKDDSGVELYVGDDMDNGSEAINKDDGRSNFVEKNEGSHTEDVADAYKCDLTSHEFYASLNTLACVDNVNYDVLGDVDHVAENSISLDTFKLFDIVDVVKSEYQVSNERVPYRFFSSHILSSTLQLARFMKKQSPGGLFWFSILSPVLKHEWEPPP
ncbi:unnamed protein product [Cuscuta campestris]|uniref:Uncharacterized protein n=1 Tax=Cuscuta campestris TaxID=132261 RepID=A0A484LI10_9ASTE|nr:unnamed protein product [Cuscuta campestris]